MIQPAYTGESNLRLWHGWSKFSAEHYTFNIYFAVILIQMELWLIQISRKSAECNLKRRGSRYFGFQNFARTHSPTRLMSSENTYSLSKEHCNLKYSGKWCFSCKYLCVRVFISSSIKYRMSFTDVLQQTRCMNTDSLIFLPNNICLKLIHKKGTTEEQITSLAHFTLREHRLSFSTAGSRSHNIVLISRGFRIGRVHNNRGFRVILKRLVDVPRMVEDRLHAAGMWKGLSVSSFEKC